MAFYICFMLASEQ